MIAVPSGRTRVRLYDPGTGAPAPTVVFLHGGGWVFGTIDSYDGFARQIAKRSGLRCLRGRREIIESNPSARCIYRWPVDEFHIGGREASEELLGQLGFSPENHVLEVGCGLGGAARVCASRYQSNYWN